MGRRQASIHVVPSDRCPIVVAIRRRQRSDFDDFYRREFPRLAGSLRIVCGEPGLAEELAQEAFTRALNHWDRLREYERPGGWLYRTAFNLLRSHWRNRQDLEAPLTVEPHVDADEGSRVDLVRLLSVLPLSQREVVLLRHVLDYSTDEAAQILQTSPAALRMTLHRAMENLRRKTAIDLAEEETR